MKRFILGCDLELHDMPAKILVIDDEPDMLELISFNLQGAGFKVSTVPDVLEGLKAAPALQPDLIILGIALPATNVFSICDLLRPLTFDYQIPVLLISTLPDEQCRTNGLARLATDCLCKPFACKELIARARAALGKKPLRAEGVRRQAEAAVR